MNTNYTRFWFYPLKLSLAENTILILIPVKLQVYSVLKTWLSYMFSFLTFRIVSI